MTSHGLTPEQIEARRGKITGSTVAAFLGYYAYKGPLDAWMESTGRAEVIQTDDMAAGNIMESGILNLALRKLQIPEDLAVKSPGTRAHAEHPGVFVVHPDCLVAVEDTGIQAKNHNPFMARIGKGRGQYSGRPGETGTEWDNALVPMAYNMQCQLEMEVMRSLGWPVKSWYLASYFGGSNVRCYKLMYHPKLIRGMMQAGLAFWRKHLDPHGPQEWPDNSTWIGRPEIPRPPQKLTKSELEGAPIPFEPDDLDPLKFPLPFLD